jgi:ubiquinone biosynthesis protein
MPNAVSSLFRLARAGLVFAEHGVRFVPKGTAVPWALTLLQWLTLPVRLLALPFRPRPRPGQTPLAAALSRLGPTYIKAGQFLATRQDLIGRDLARDLAGLQDRMPPFPDSIARQAVADALGQPVVALYAAFGPAVAAASIAQVHRATVRDANGGEREVAVKILRPGIERRFNNDLSSFAFAARQIERWHPPSRRLKPTSVVATLARTVDLEMDLRMEAAAISEMADNIKNDAGFRVPAIDWQRTARSVMTIEWVDGTPISDKAALQAQGFDVLKLGEDVIRHFLRHAMRDGFFHADMHQGNLFVDPTGTIVAVDFGIMGRLSPKERRFLAEILFGFISRDYRRAAAAHFAAGYVPAHQSVDVFAQALRAIGEPLLGRPAEEISMGHLLGQLFAYTEVFEMQTRPELIMLQKSMVVVEGVARTLDPRLNIWSAAEPIVRDWLEQELGVPGRLREAGEGAGQMGKFVADLPLVLLSAERAASAFADMARDGVRLDDATIAKLAQSQARSGRFSQAALWIGVLSLAALAVIAAARFL